MGDEPAFSRRAAVGALGTAVIGGVIAPQRGASSHWPGILGWSSGPVSVSPFPSRYRLLRIPAASFRPNSSTTPWALTPDGLTTAVGTTCFAAAEVHDGDQIEAFTVWVDPGGHPGTITMTRTRPGTTLTLATRAFEAGNGLTSVNARLAEGTHAADTMSWTYGVSVELGPGAVLHSAVLEYTPTRRELVLIEPTRVWDTRSIGTGLVKLAAGDTRTITVRSAVSAFAVGAMLNVTVDQTEGSGYLSVYGPPPNGDFPETSNLNWSTPGQTIANLVLSQLTGDAEVAVRAGGTGRAHFIIDVLGYYV